MQMVHNILAQKAMVQHHLTRQGLPGHSLGTNYIACLDVLYSTHTMYIVHPDVILYHRDSILYPRILYCMSDISRPAYYIMLGKIRHNMSRHEMSSLWIAPCIQMGLLCQPDLWATMVCASMTGQPTKIMKWNYVNYVIIKNNNTYIYNLNI